jgi:acetyl-CoA carboxylase biotin carboxyl carrier protein
MTNETVRLVAREDGTGEAGGGTAAEVLQRLQESTLTLLAGLDRAPKSLRIRADQVEIELAWPEPTLAAQPVVPGAPPAPAGPAPTAEDGTGRFLTAHTVGMFYQCPEPGAAPFVEVGDVVVPGQQVGIIEAMKLMIAVEAEEAGRIVEVLVPNATPVEYGEKLFAVEPTDC